MKVYSWNVWCDNEPDRVFSYVKELDYDILCLQEVTPAMLALLETLPVSLAVAAEGVRTHPGKGEELNYSIILTRYPILSQKEILLPVVTYPPRARLISSLFGWSYSRERRALHTELDIAGRRVSVISVHFTLSTPTQRALELEEITAATSEGPVIIAGDFNILESWYIHVFNWIKGARFVETLPWFDERGRIEKVFANVGLVNAHRGKITHPISQSQLDHILFSDDFTMTGATVIKDSHGSDHRPVTATLTL